jgi:uncharacterized protein (TIGR03086 family)
MKGTGTAMDTIAQLEGTFASTQRIVDNIDSSQLNADTPCEDWNVRLVLAHIVGVMRHFEAAAVGEEQPIPDPADVDLGDDPAATYRAAASGALAAWSRPGVLDGNLKVAAGEMPATTVANINALDTLVHGWDIARGTGQDAALDPALAEASLAFAQRFVPDDVRGSGFMKPAVAVGDDASPTDRLVAFCGRRP